MIELNRRGLIGGLIGTLVAAPAIVRAANIMPVRTPALLRPAVDPQPGFVGNASISGDVLVVTSVAAGSLQLGMRVSGAGLPEGTTITGQITGAPGSVGAYLINGTMPGSLPSQTISAAGLIP
jgi:hypothetical protein